MYIGLAALGAFILYLIVKSIIENIKLALIHYIVYSGTHIVMILICLLFGVLIYLQIVWRKKPNEKKTYSVSYLFDLN